MDDIFTKPHNKLVNEALHCQRRPIVNLLPLDLPERNLQHQDLLANEIQHLTQNKERLQSKLDMIISIILVIKLIHQYAGEEDALNSC